MIARAVCPGLSVFSASLLWIVVLSVGLEILVVGLLRHSNNNNNNIHNIVRMNRNDATLVKSRKFKDCVLSWKVGKTFASAVHVFLGLVFSVFFCVHVPGCEIEWYCGSSGDNDLMIRICVFCLRQFVALFGPVSAAIMVGRSVFVCSTFVDLSRF